MRKSKSVAVGTTAVAGVAALILGAGAASAAPIPTEQTPARATGISGLLLPSIYRIPVNAESTATPGTVMLSAPAAMDACSATISRALVRISWRNIASGASGTTIVKPCHNTALDAPASAAVNVGAGRISFVATVTGSALLPTAGQPAFPGFGAFTAA